MANFHIDASSAGNDNVHPGPDAAIPEAESTLPVAPSSGSHVDLAVLLFDEMKGAADAGVAVARAARVLEAFTAASCKERDAAVSQNGILKKAFLVQYRLLGEQQAEVQRLQLQIAGCQKQVTNLETENYVLSMHLKQATSSSMPDHFHPEIF